ncbi:MAG TPA: glycosyl hydrolase [Anaerohalosphaeraceae bacterium]|nr:glycosyl hydrolase [Anaerohalosphaeraceae bacterium]HQG05256.1 glycosyl hydrolase [Anaerohalosphaeraceae bacterium]HQI06974.1 glycosyl hydrolase [Anaerohalosphaeraceae bacterium]HQJ66670.1 glycosyl hydrolase [Anaerohalosphaeraceae bacterium]
MGRLTGYTQKAAVMAAMVLLTQGYAKCALDEIRWPTPTAENKPWTRWWWLGSAVDEANLTSLLTEYSKAGIGGVEICPIYGAKGYEDRFIDFLTLKWMKMLAHTTAEAQRLGMAVDLTTGTGWPFGGPHVTEQTASMKVLLERYSAPSQEVFSSSIPKNPKARLICLMAVEAKGQRIDLTLQVQNGQIRWQVPEGNWTIYELASRCPVQKVKRAAPGGQGNVVDPYSVSALNAYLAAFDKAFEGYEGKMPRAHFHDSFEYFEADWTADFLREFRQRNGYDLREHIEALFGDDSAETVARVKCDYRQTISHLHIAYIERWTQWCHQYGSLSRNQAHGAPANLIDLYAAADIPETEIFRSVDSGQIPMLKMASSAAHLKGQILASSESFTWLKEHFQASLADTKAAADLLFLAGINHVFFHGIPYSPQDAPWPGWQFYASVNFGPDGGLWHDLPAFTDYLTRCQSLLQAGRPDNDILLYWPVYDLWQDPKGLYLSFPIHNQERWFSKTSFYQTAMMLWSKGYAWDTISDSFLQKAAVEEGKILLGGNRYSVILVPSCRVMPLETLKALIGLADKGAAVLFCSELPSAVPGLNEWTQRQEAMKEMLGTLQFEKGPDASVQQCRRGLGRVGLGPAESLLESFSVCREECVDAGIQWIRRSCLEGTDYFFVNLTSEPVSSWVKLGRSARSAVLMDPLMPDAIGAAAVRQEKGQTCVYVQLNPGQSIFVRAFSDKQIETPRWNYTQPKEEPVSIGGIWTVDFLEGGPTLPKSRQIERLSSWTTWGDPETECFAGSARYSIEFEKPSSQAEEWLLDVGTVCESARVRLNGQDVSVLWSPASVCRVGKFLREGKNTLEIEVTNLAANRIRDLDRRQVLWKYFYDINIVNINYKPFDASDWPLRDSGLLGPVSLIPLAVFHPSEESLSPIVNKRPVLFIVGDSTVKNNTAGLQGWGDPLADFFDLTRISVCNRALGGRSSRTFLTEGLWEKVLGELKAGDFVLIQFGHNDGGPLETGRARGSLKGIGDEVQEVILEATGQKEVVHTYGWYLRKYIRDAKAKGAIPIVCSLVPRNIWKEGQVVRSGADYARWAAQVAQTEGAYFIDLNEKAACRYEEDGQDKVTREYFLEDHTHTTPAGARVTAQIVAEEIRTLSDCTLREYLKN